MLWFGNAMRTLNPTMLDRYTSFQFGEFVRQIPSTMAVQRGVKYRAEQLTRMVTGGKKSVCIMSNLETFLFQSKNWKENTVRSSNKGEQVYSDSVLLYSNTPSFVRPRNVSWSRKSCDVRVCRLARVMRVLIRSEMHWFDMQWLFTLKEWVEPYIS